MTVLLDWFSREGHLLLSWWLWIALAGLAVLPLCHRVFGGLPDRGYTLARPLGLLLVTWVFWLLNSYGFLDNSRGSIILCWLLILSASLALYFRNRETGALVNWWRENLSFVLVTELLFALLFLGWALYRAHQNGLTGTEKPMELAFLSASQRSVSFPPDDPWLSGYAISYYYMGYIMSSALATLTGISSTIGFNLTNASLFALTGTAAFGVVYNLVRSRYTYTVNGAITDIRSRAAAISTGLLATLILVLMGNFQFALIEAPFQSRAASQSFLEYWDTQKLPDFERIDYQQGESARLSLDTSSWSHWWWFNASRVPTDYDLNNRLTGTQPIGEFPAFSFLLADNHPHVLALPFVVTVIGLMLNLVLLRQAPRAEETLLYGIAVGGLAFLNAWDGPTFLFGLIGAEALRRLMTSETGRLTAWDWLGLVKFGATLALIAFVAYLPYFVGFRSQAGGVLPNLLHPSQFRHFFIMYGPLIVILGIYLFAEAWRSYGAQRLNWRLGLSVSAILLGALLLLITLVSIVLAISNPGQPIVGNMASQSNGFGDLPQQLIQRRLEYGLTTILLLLGLALVIARLFPAWRGAAPLAEVAVNWIKYPPATGFVLLIVGMGLCLTLFCEFFYLKDNFFVRINTVFKLYYQAWVLWSIAAAYAIYSLLCDKTLRKPQLLLRVLIAAVSALSILAGLLYTIVGVNHRAWIETGRQYAAEQRRVTPPVEWTNSSRHVYDGEHVSIGDVVYSRLKLDEAEEPDLLRAQINGIATFDGDATVIYEPLTLDGEGGLLDYDDKQVIKCLSKLVGRSDAVVAEAVGQAYNIAFGRVGALTGIPIILGWENHERQWRGATYPSVAGTRAADLRDLYVRHEFNDIQPIIERYQITHILYGSTERREYGSLGEDKFLDQLPIACESGLSRIYYAGV